MKDFAFYSGVIAVGTIAADIARYIINGIVQRAAERRIMAMQRELAASVRGRQPIAHGQPVTVEPAMK